MYPSLPLPSPTPSLPRKPPLHLTPVLSTPWSGSSRSEGPVVLVSRLRPGEKEVFRKVCKFLELKKPKAEDLRSTTTLSSIFKLDYRSKKTSERDGNLKTIQLEEEEEVGINTLITDSSPRLRWKVPSSSSERK